MHPALLQDSAGLGTHPEAISTAQKPAVNIKCAWRNANQSGPEEGAETSLGPGCPDKPGWGSRNGNQTKKNKPLPAAGWELARVLELPSSSPPARSSTDCLFAPKPKLHEALPKRQPLKQEAASWGAQHELQGFLAAQTGTHGTAGARQRVQRVQNKATGKKACFSALSQPSSFQMRAGRTSGEKKNNKGITKTFFPLRIIRSQLTFKAASVRVP